ncbi:MAG: rhomboid family intramembrane serine protease [Muribaculaceae bacterium]|nr:rhomboid family intramembrane serine protease [Muribaculaceae bacterium]
MSGNRFSSFVASIPPVTKNLIIINLIIWVAEALFPRFASFIVHHLGLHYVPATEFNPVQLITYLFIHAESTPLHVLFNMFTLLMFGVILERVWGSKRFFIFYFVCGVGAALVQELVWSLTWMNDYIGILARQNGLTADTVREIVHRELAAGDPELLSAMSMMKNSLVTIGASGAVFGVIMGFAMVFPDRPMYVMFIPIPIKAKYLMIFYGVLEFFLGVAEIDMVAHFAHLGGMLFGLVLLLYWKKKGTLYSGGFY